MSPAPALSRRKSLSPAVALLFGTITVGGLDILDAIIFFSFRDVAPIQIFQSIASGLLGRAAFSGGLPTAMLGALLHFFIAFIIVTVYYLASRWWPHLAQRPLVYGPLYGLIVYATMNLIVIPLSAAASGMPPLPVLINGLLIHMLGVGLPSALFAQAAHRSPHFEAS
jgi:hypothetical protein